MAIKLIVLDNVINGKFIVPMDHMKFHSELTNPRVAPDLENSILIEYENAFFEKTSMVGEKAETQRFCFFRYDEDSKDDVIWVSIKGETVEAQ